MRIKKRRVICMIFFAMKKNANQTRRLIYYSFVSCANYLKKLGFSCYMKLNNCSSIDVPILQKILMNNSLQRAIFQLLLCNLKNFVLYRRKQDVSLFRKQNSCLIFFYHRLFQILHRKYLHIYLQVNNYQKNVIFRWKLTFFLIHHIWYINIIQANQNQK